MEIFMLKHPLTLPLFSLFLGGIFLSFSSAYNSNNSSSSKEASQDSRPGISDEKDENKLRSNQTTRQKKIAYIDERDQDIHHRANRRGEWGYKQNYRYDRKAFYKGETQGEAYDLENPDSAGGIGLDPDTEYLQMRKFYLEEANRNRQNGRNEKQDSNQRRQLSKNDTSNQNSNSNSNNNNSNDDDCSPRNPSHRASCENHGMAQRYPNSQYSNLNSSSQNEPISSRDDNDMNNYKNPSQRNFNYESQPHPAYYYPSNNSGYYPYYNNYE